MSGKKLFYKFRSGKGIGKMAALDAPPQRHLARAAGLFAPGSRDLCRVLAGVHNPIINTDEHREGHLWFRVT